MRTLFKKALLYLRALFRKAVVVKALLVIRTPFWRVFLLDHSIKLSVEIINTMIFYGFTCVYFYLLYFLHSYRHYALCMIQRKFKLYSCVDESTGITQFGSAMDRYVVDSLRACPTPN